MFLLCAITSLCPLCPLFLAFSFDILTCPVLCLICMQPSSAAPGICQLSYDQVTAATALAFVSASLSVLCVLFLPDPLRPIPSFLFTLLVSLLLSVFSVYQSHIIYCIIELSGLTTQLESLPPHARHGLHV